MGVVGVLCHDLIDAGINPPWVCSKLIIKRLGFLLSFFPSKGSLQLPQPKFLFFDVGNFFFFFFDFSFRAPGLRLPPQVWLAFCMASISIYCHNNNNKKNNNINIFNQGEPVS